MSSDVSHSTGAANTSTTTKRELTSSVVTRASNTGKPIAPAVAMSAEGQRRNAVPTSRRKVGRSPRAIACRRNVMTPSRNERKTKKMP